MKYITICLSSSMFGGLVTVPSNSPHLRKSGSRPVVSDLGTIKLQAFELWAFCSYNFFFPLMVAFSLHLMLVVECLLGTGELENGVEEGFLHSIEANDMKGVSTPVSTAAIMPSPILLWRFKVLLVLIY